TVVSDLQRYGAALADARVRRIELAAQRARALALAKDDVLTSPVFALASSEQVVEQLKLEYARAMQEFVDIDAKYGPKAEQNIAAKEKVDKLHPQLDNEAARAVREIDERYQAVVVAEKGYQALVDERKQDVERLDKLYTAYAPLLRDQKSAELEYTQLLTRLE